MITLRDIDPGERHNLIETLAKFVGTMALERQHDLLEYFVDVLLGCGIRPADVIFYCNEAAGNQWHGLQVGAGQSFGIGCIQKVRLPLSLRIEARSVYCHPGTWLFDTLPGHLEVSHNGKPADIASSGRDDIIAVLKDILGGPKRIHDNVVDWLKKQHHLTPEELEQQHGVIGCYVQTAVLHGLEPSLRPLGHWSYGSDQGRWRWRRMLAIKVGGANSLLLISHGLPVSSTIAPLCSRHMIEMEEVKEE